MRTFLTVLLVIVICLFVICALFSFLGALMGITFGAIGLALGYVWRVVLSPAILIVFIVWVVVRLSKRSAKK